MYLAPLNYDRFFRKVFSDEQISKKFLEDFLGVEIETIELLKYKHKLTDDASIVEFDFRCKIDGSYVIIDMQQWYKQDIVQRFYTYHAANTVLQLEHIDNRKLTNLDNREIKNYRKVLPVITLIWMVHDRLGFTEDYISYTMLPEMTRDFIMDKKKWQKAGRAELEQEQRTLANILQNNTKNLKFLQQNRLIFAFQSNIVKNRRLEKYVRWFQFAEKTRHSDNTKEDFSSYRKDNVFKEIMRKLDKEEIKDTDFEAIKYHDLYLSIIDEKEYQAKLEEKLSIAKKCLMRGLSIKDVVGITELPIEKVQAVADSIY